MSETVYPPAWADALLRTMLPLKHRDNVSGDLLEEYRDAIVPSRGQRAANWWYIGQAAGFVWRSSWLFGMLLATSIVGRDVIDWWLSPTQDFYARSVVSTWLAVSLFAGVGVRIAWRSRSAIGGALAGVAAGLVAAVSITLVSALQLAIWHDAHTMAMIRASGGVDEVFVLPFVMIVPGAVCAAIGAWGGKTAARLIESHELQQR